MSRSTPIQGRRRALALAGLALLGGPAAAVVVAGPGGSAEQGRRLVVAAPVAGAEQPAPALLAGRIEAVEGAGVGVAYAGCGRQTP